MAIKERKPNEQLGIFYGDIPEERWEKPDVEINDPKMGNLRVLMGRQNGGYVAFCQIEKDGVTSGQGSYGATLNNAISSFPMEVRDLIIAEIERKSKPDVVVFGSDVENESIRRTLETIDACSKDNKRIVVITTGMDIVKESLQEIIELLKARDVESVKDELLKVYKKHVAILNGIELTSLRKIDLCQKSYKLASGFYSDANSELTPAREANILRYGAEQNALFLNAVCLDEGLPVKVIEKPKINLKSPEIQALLDESVIPIIAGVK